MRASLIVAALAGAVTSEPAVPTGAWGLVVRHVVDEGMAVAGTLHVRADGGFLLECRISGTVWGPDSKTAVWGHIDVSGAVVTGRVEGGEDMQQLPNRRFILRFGDPHGGWTSDIPGCPQEATAPR